MLQPAPRSTRSGLAIAILLAAPPLASPAMATVLIDPETAVQSALEDLGSDSVRKRYWGTVILGRYPETAAPWVPDLINALRDPEWAVRLGAARALEAVATHDSEGSVGPALTACLLDSSEPVRAAAAFALVKIPQVPRVAGPLLAAGAASDSPLLRIASVAALAEHFPESAGSTSERSDAAALAGVLLLEALDAERDWTPSDGCDWEPERDTIELPGLQAVRLGAVTALLDPDTAFGLLPELISRYDAGSSAAFHTARAMAPYLGSFRSSWMAGLHARDVGARRLAVMTIGMLGVSDPDVTASLAGMLRPGAPTAIDAARALGLLGAASRPTVPALENLLLESTDRALRETTGWALIKIDHEAVQPVADRIRSTDPDFADWLSIRAILSRL